MSEKVILVKETVMLEFLMSLIIGFSRIVLPILAVVILTKCMLSLVLGHPKEKTYGYIIDMLDGESYPLNMWETSIGRSNSCDIVVGYDTVSRFQAVISRRIDGWYVYDLKSKSGVKINGEDMVKKATVTSGDVLSFGGYEFRFMVADDPVVRVGKKKRGRKNQTPLEPLGADREPQVNSSVYENQTPYGTQKTANTNAYTNVNTNPAAQPYTPPYEQKTAESDSVYGDTDYNISGGESESLYDGYYTYSSMGDYYTEDNKPELHFEKRREMPFKETFGVPKRESERSEGDSIYSDKPTYTVETPGRRQSEESFTYMGAKPAIFNRDRGEVFILCGNTVSIGRSRGNDIRLEAPNASRHHADLVLYEDGWAIVDANSSAGTTLNGERITEPQLLFEGDVIGLGDERLYFTRNPSLYK